MSTDDMLQMGTVGKAHGLKGEVFINWHAEWPLRAKQTIYLARDSVKQPFTISSSRPHKGRYIVLLDGITDRGEAELLTGLAVFVPKKCLPAISPGEAYVHDLIGSQVFLLNGQLIGSLDHVEFPANQQIWSIIDETGREILFPAQPHFIIAIDSVNHKITINPPDGLLDIYRA